MFELSIIIVFKISTELLNSLSRVVLRLLLILFLCDSSHKLHIFVFVIPESSVLDFGYHLPKSIQYQVDESIH